MSAGSFKRSKYEDDATAVHPIRVQPETVIAGTNPEPAGDVGANQVSARVSGGKRELGLIARHITVTWTGTVPDGYKTGGVLRIPILTRAAFNNLTLHTKFQYLGNEVEVIGRTPESLK